MTGGAGEPDGGRPGGGSPPKTPFSFKLMVALAVLYLGWRLVQGIVAFVRWIG